jgi:hypothetical protein
MGDFDDFLDANASEESDYDDAEEEVDGWMRGGASLIDANQSEAEQMVTGRRVLDRLLEQMVQAQHNKAASGANTEALFEPVLKFQNSVRDARDSVQYMQVPPQPNVTRSNQHQRLTQNSVV